MSILPRSLFFLLGLTASFALFAFVNDLEFTKQSSNSLHEDKHSDPAVDPDLGYKFPSFSGRKKLPPASGQPQLEGQVFLADPRFNLGGDSGKDPYQTFYNAHKKTTPANTIWTKWIEGSLSNANASSRPGTTVVKLILMTKDEWSLIEKWVLYHGKLLGFEHLYIIDGSTDEKCVSFLKQARDELGVNVIFSKAGLNDLDKYLSQLGRDLGPSSDVILKMDSDEFLVFQTGNRTYVSLSNHAVQDDAYGKNSTDTDCSLSPYGITEYLNSKSFRTLLSGQTLRIGSASLSTVDPHACESGKGAMYVMAGTPEENRLVGFSIQTSRLDFFKSAFDSRTVNSINLGGHVAKGLPPFDCAKVPPTKLGILHFHARCPHDLLLIDRKVVRGHGYVKETETDEEALARFKKQCKRENLCGITDKEIGSIASSHKVKGYLEHLDGCTNKGFQTTSTLPCESDAGRLTINPDFYHFLNVSLSKFSYNSNGTQLVAE